MVSQPPGAAISVVNEKPPSSKFLSDLILGMGLMTPGILQGVYFVYCHCQLDKHKAK